MTAETASVIDGNARFMGVIGDPIAQVRTPEAINPIFRDRGSSIVCVPMHVPDGHLAHVWPGLRAIRNLVGFGVTLPHKFEAAKLCDSLDTAADRVAAANVVRREADGRLKGYQFDGSGFVAGVQAQGHDIKGRNVLIIGAGGAATAIAFSLADVGAARITIANRTPSKAERIAGRLNVALGKPVASAGAVRPDSHDLIINATSLGMNSSDRLPLDPNLITPDMLVAEVVANPEITPFLEVALARGARIHSGIHMIAGQAGLIANHLLAVQS